MPQSPPGSGSMQFRAATHDDLGPIIAMTARTRERLASWSPRWWAKSAAADDIHPKWLEHLMINEPGSMHVATVGNLVVGCFGVRPQATQWFLDNVSVRDDTLWPGFITGLVGYLRQRPALTCVAPQDHALAVALSEAGSDLVLSYWVQPTTAGSTPVAPVDPSAVASERALHTFGGAPFDHTAPDALAFTTRDGTVVGTPPTTAPPVYDPGGTVTVVDFVAGPNPKALLHSALGAAGSRGDVLLCVICRTDDADLAAALHGCGFTHTHTVDVYRLPTR